MLFDAVKKKKEEKKERAKEKDPKKKNEKKKESMTEMLIAQQYGDLIDSISKNLISCLKIGFFSKKLFSGGLAVVPNKVIGKAICNAINPDPNSDLSKANFFFTLLFNEKDSQKIPEIELDEFDLEKLLQSILKLEPFFKPVESSLQQKNTETKEFYEKLANKILELIQLAAPKAPNFKETTGALVDFLKVILMSPKLLDILIYDYVIKFLLM